MHHVFRVHTNQKHGDKEVLRNVPIAQVGTFHDMSFHDMKQIYCTLPPISWHLCIPLLTILDITFKLRQ